MVVDRSDANLWRKNITVSLAGASFLAITQILTLDCPPILLVASVWIFAPAIPILLLYGLTKYPEPDPETKSLSEEQVANLIWFCRIVLFDLFGLALIFFHFGLVPGISFSVVVVCSFVKFLRIRVAHREHRMSLYELVLLLLLHPLYSAKKEIKHAPENGEA